MELLLRRETPNSAKPTHLEFDVASERDITLLICTKSPIHLITDSHNSTNSSKSQYDSTHYQPPTPLRP